MKASTAATVLRSMRSRAETTGGIVQMGEYEQFAIAVALATVESDLAPKGVTIEMDGLSFSMLKVDEAWFELIRTAYKMLDQMPPDDDFKISEETLAAIFSGKGKSGKKGKPKIKEPTSKEFSTPADEEWIKGIMNSVPAKASDVPDEPKDLPEPEETKGNEDTGNAS